MRLDISQTFLIVYVKSKLLQKFICGKWKESIVIHYYFVGGFGIYAFMLYMYYGLCILILCNEFLIKYLINFAPKSKTLTFISTI